MRISVSMIALNEEKQIGRALSSCSFADEIVVVDGGSTDRTMEILAAYEKVVLLRHPWEGHFGKQRQVSLDRCSGDWIIRLDADEAYSEKFERGIRDLLASAGPDIGGYTIHQCNLVGNENFYSRALDQYEPIPRVWRNRFGVKWERHIHEYLVGIVGKVLPADLYVVHYGFLDREKYWRKGERYSTIPGSGFSAPSQLVYREYDVQPRPPSSKVAAHVPPFPSLKPSGAPKVAAISAPVLDPSVMACLEPLRGEFDITAYTIVLPADGPYTAGLPVAALPGGGAPPGNYMVGLEAELLDKEIVLTGDLSEIFTFQAAAAKVKFGNRIVSRTEGIVPFAHEHDEQAKRMKRLSRRMVDAFVADTERARDALVREGIPGERIFTVPAGVDLETFAPDRREGRETRASLGIPAEATVVLYAGKRICGRAVRALLCAGKAVLCGDRKKEALLRFVVAGGSVDGAALERTAAEMGLKSSFLFLETERYADLPRLFRTADLFVLPGPSDGMRKGEGDALLAEALASGVPVVGPDSGAVREIAGPEAILVRPGDAEDLARGIRALADSEELRRSAGAAGRRRAEKMFDSREAARRLGEVFRSVLSLRHAAV